MKKIRRKTVIILVAVVLLLFLPIPSPAANDGGTVEFRAMTYSIVKWHRILPTADASGKADMYIKAVSVLKIIQNGHTLWMEQK